MDTTLNRIFWEAKASDFLFYVYINLLKPGLMTNGNYKCAKKIKMKKTWLESILIQM